MNVLDMLILVILLAGIVRGFSTGLVRQVTSIAALILGFVLAVQLMGQIGDLLRGVMEISERAAPLIGFVLVFVGIQILFFVLARLVEALLGALKLSMVNRAFGGMAGAILAALVLSITFLVLGYLGIPNQDARDGSMLYAPVSAVLPEAWDLVAERVPQVDQLSSLFGERASSASD
jgi:membrane protein required for colicin V production